MVIIVALNKSSINFSMVYIPIAYTSLLKNNDLDFKMIDKNTMSRIKYKKVNIENGKEVLSKDIVKGYEYDEDKYVILEDKDFEKIKTQKDKNITIDKFVDLDEIDPIYYDKPYLVTSLGADHAFNLLAQAMENKNKVGIAKTIIGQKETLIILRSKNGQIYMNSLFFEDMLKDIDKNDIKENFPKKELDMAETLIDNMTSSFNPKDYKDLYKEKLLNAIEKKIAGKKITKAREPRNNQQKISNLMDALTESIKATNKKGKKK